MLYLFNSAGDEGYVTNVLNTLHLPEKSENVYQYSVNLSNGKSDNNYVQSILSSYYQHNKKLQNQHKEVLIIFVDKESDPYRYIPLRKARLKQVKYVDDRIYFYVELLEYCHSSSIKDFNSFISKKYANLLFRKPDNKSVIDTELTKKHLGYLAFEGNSEINNQIQTNNESWTKTVHMLAELNVFKKRHSIFTKVAFDNFSRKGLTKNLNSRSELTLWKGFIYRAIITYYNPNESRNNQLKMVIAPEESLSKIENLQTKLQLSSGVTIFSFLPKKACKAGMMSFGSNRAEQDIIFADKEIRYKVHRPLKTWIVIIILLIIAAFSLYATSDVGALDSILALFHISVTQNMKTVISIFSSVASVLSLWGASTLFSGSK